MSTDQPFRLALAVVLALTAVRVAVLFVSGLDLQADEAQYWVWSTSLDWGYFSKPPLIAWVIALTAAFGDGDAWVRLAAPLLHGATALLLYGLAARLFGARRAMWTAIVYATLPAVTYSSALISTDVPLLFLWALALLALDRLLESPTRGRALLLGLAIGFGLLAKYAMAYFLLGMGLLALLDRDARRVLLGRRALEALLVAGLCLLPNVLWNMNHGWVTAGHTASNAHWAQAFRDPAKGLEFVAAQFGVFGPILLAALGVRLAGLRRRPIGPAERFLLVFSLPVLGLVALQSFVSRAHANWAATAYVAATPLVVAWLFAHGRRWLTASTALHGAVFAVFAAVMSGAVALPLDRDPLDRLRGWPAVAGRVGELAGAQRVDAILVHDRALMGALLRYLPDPPAPLRIWPGDAAVHNHYELVLPLTADLASGRVLYVTEADEETSIPSRAARVAATGRFDVPLTGGHVRGLSWYRLEDIGRLW